MLSKRTHPPPPCPCPTTLVTHHRCVGAEWVTILPCQSKVTDLELPTVAVQQVAGLEVSVNDPSVVQEGHTLQQLLHQALDLTDAELLCLQAAQQVAGGAEHVEGGGGVRWMGRTQSAQGVETLNPKLLRLQGGSVCWAME